MSTPQTFAVTVPHSTSQLALGRCACPDGASLTTVGSVLVDAAGTLTVQSDGTFTAQTNATMSWLSQAKTEAHTSAGFQIYAGGGTAPGACGSGMPAASPGATKPAETTEKAVNVGLAAASLGRNVVDALGADNAAGVAVQVLDAAKNIGEAGKDLGSDKAGVAAPYAETASGLVGVGAAIASGDLAGGLGALATVASGVAGAAAGPTDIEERAVNEIKMVAGTMITASAGIGFDYKTLNKFSVTAGALTSFTTTVWGAFCLLKFEVKAIGAVKMKTAKVEVKAKKAATLDAKAKLTFDSPFIDYESKLEVTKTLNVTQKTTVHSLEVKNAKKSTIDGNLTVTKNMKIHQDMLVEKNLDAKKDVKVSKKTKAKGAASVSGKTKVS